MLSRVVRADMIRATTLTFDNRLEYLRVIKNPTADRMIPMNGAQQHSSPRKTHVLATNETRLTNRCFSVNGLADLKSSSEHLAMNSFPQDSHPPNTLRQRRRGIRCNSMNHSV